MDVGYSFDDLVLFVRDEISEYKLSISDQTQIEDDLGVTGCDAVQLIKKFSKKFNVNINFFKYNQYFYPEPSIFNSFSEKIKPLTIGHLYRAIKVGRLDDTIIESEII